MAIQSNFPAIKPSLLLDFANVKQLDPRITYTRASTATYYDGVTTAKAEENFFLYSQDFTNAYWLKTVTTVTANAAVAPDGTSTATAFPAVTSGTLNAITNNSATGIVAGQPLVISIYAKANTASFLQITPGTPILASAFANFDLSTGTAGNIGGTGLTSSITSVGNGWYRCVVTIASVSGLGVVVFSLIDSNTSTRQSAYTGTAGNSIYIWGAQEELRSAVSAYTATTTQPITNYIPVLQTAASGVARFDHNPTTDESLGLLIEESRTNIVTYSSQFDNAAWTKTSSTITADTIVAPDGTLSSDKIIVDNSISIGNSNLLQNISKAATATTYTYTIYSKVAELNAILLYVRDTGSVSNRATVTFSLSSGAISTAATAFGTFTSASATSTSVGNGWYRFSLTFTSGTETAISARVYPSDSVKTTGDGYSGLYIWGAQLEAGPFSTSYIPTVASQVTRAADDASMTSTNFSSWYNQGEGAFYAEAATSVYDIGRTIFETNDGTASNRLYLGRNSSTTSGIGTIITGGATQANIPVSNTFVGGGSGRLSMSFVVNTINVAGNGTLGTTDTTAILPVVNSIRIGAAFNGSTVWNGTIKKIAYYPLKATSAQLQALTS